MRSICNGNELRGKVFLMYFKIQKYYQNDFLFINQIENHSILKYEITNNGIMYLAKEKRNQNLIEVPKSWQKHNGYKIMSQLGKEKIKLRNGTILLHLKMKLVIEL